MPPDTENNGSELSTEPQDTNAQGGVSSPERAELEAQIAEDRDKALQDLLHDDPEPTDSEDDSTEDQDPDVSDEDEGETDETVESDDDDEDETDAELSDNEQDDDDDDDTEDDDHDDDGTDEDEEDDEDEDEARKALSKRGRKNFDKVLKDRRELRERVQTLEGDASYGKAVKDFVDNNGWTDQDLESWLMRGNELRKADKANQAQMLAQWASDLGHEPAQQGPDLSKVRKRISDMANEYEILTPELAKEILQELSGITTPAPAPDKKSPKGTASFTPPGSNTSTQSSPTTGFSEAEMLKGRNDLSTEIDKARKKVGEKAWPKIHAIATSKLQRYKGIHPSQWAEVFADVVDGEIARRKARKPPKRTPSKSLRGTSSDRAPAAPKDESEITREDIIRDLTGE